MNNMLSLAEKIIAVAGVLLCVVAGVMRLTGSYYVAGIESMTLFVVGMGGMLAAILLKLHMD